MLEVTENGKMALKLIFTDFLTHYNSYNIKDKLGLSNAGSLKLLRSLHDKNLLTSEKLGNAIFYKPNLENSYLMKLLELIFLDYSTLSSFVKGWIYDLHSLSSHTNGIFLFGSILRKGKEARDIDVCFILKKSEDYKLLQRMIKEMNEKNRLKIEPLYLTQQDFEKKLIEKDKPLIEMVKSCVVVHGHELFVEVVKNVQSKQSR
ncbi:nucleotidyltransferase domain-containing protein [Candidatus Woesearchaeota archaeon]|nr:nucleotidyltransferase domain-containing protein [Candidatus Woesearchaeota archaeon]